MPARCHTANVETPSIRDGVMPLLAGGHLFALPLGNVDTPNLTPDRETGIGRYTDAQIVRAIYRYLRTLPPSDHDPVPSVQAKKPAQEKKKAA